MRRNFPHLGFDPTPGDVEQSRVLARQIGNLAAELNRTVSELSKIDSTGWTGKAAIAFRQHVDHDVQPLIVKADNSFNHASSALNKWASQLEGFQAEADALEREAATKQATLDGANKALNAAGGPPPVISVPSSSPSDTDHVQQQRQKQHAATEASSALDSVRSRAHELHDRYMRAAGAVGRSLEKAGHIAPAKPGFFHNLVNDVEHSWDATCDWVKKHADLIKAISDVLGDIAAIVQIAALICLPIEPLGAILEGVSLGLNALSLVGDLVAKAGGANVSWLSIGMSAFGVIPGIGALAKGSEVAVDGVKAGERAAQLMDKYGGVVTKGSEEARNWIGGAKNVEGGIKLKGVALFGKKTGLETVKGTNLRGRFAALAEKKIEGGQSAGSGGILKGIKGAQSLMEKPFVRKIVGNDGALDNVSGKIGKLGEHINPTSGTWRGIDSGVAGVNFAHKVYGQIPEFRQEFGARFHEMASAF